LSVAGRAPEPGNSDAAGFVLAGGQSSRMGQDKALLSFAGQPLVANALFILRQAGLAASIAGASSSFADFAPLVEDAQPGLGPLSGLCAALASTPARHAVFLPVDLPLLPASLIAFLLRHAQTTGRAVTLPSVNSHAQTFPAVLHRAVLPVLQAELDAGRRGCFSAFQAAAAGRGEPMSVVAAELLAQAGQVFHPGGLPASCWFLNVNTPADLLRTAAHTAASIA
jgi:molybdopterin-guanine dinucleotide biosynthesis protein A